MCDTESNVLTVDISFKENSSQIQIAKQRVMIISNFFAYQYNNFDRTTKYL